MKKKLTNDSNPPPKQKRRTFVRPNCSKVWCFQCLVCLKKHYKYGAHRLCYRKWCDICQTSFDTEEIMALHATKYHAKNFCNICNQTYNNIKVHKSNCR